MNLDNALYHKHKVMHDEVQDKYEIEIIDQERKIDIFAQRVYSNVKIYDNIISFIKKNKKLLSLVRKAKKEDDNSFKNTEKFRDVKLIFKK